MSYLNRKRPTGSQVEVPKYRIEGKRAVVSGYQKFAVSRRDVDVSNSNYHNKFMFLRHFLIKSKMFTQSTTVSDLGCSNGLVSFLASQQGYTRVNALDHDQECLNLIRNVARALGISNITPKSFKFGNPIAPSDVTLACALIHWVYSCTANFGSLDAIMKYLRSITNKVLLVEWVSPQDPGVKSFNHLSFKINKVKQPYNLAHFEAALKKNFAVHKRVYTTVPTRWLYVATVEDSESTRKLFDALAQVNRVLRPAPKSAPPRPAPKPSRAKVSVSRRPLRLRKIKRVSKIGAAKGRLLKKRTVRKRR